EPPRLMASPCGGGCWRAHLHAPTATGLLRSHAARADAYDARLARRLGLRDVMRADNVTAVLTREGQRGPTLMFGHNLHLQTGRSKWHLGDLSLEWWSVGSIIGAQLGDQYAVLSSALGAAPHQGLNAPAPDTLEGILCALPE